MWIFWNGDESPNTWEENTQENAPIENVNAPEVNWDNQLSSDRAAFEQEKADFEAQKAKLTEGQDKLAAEEEAFELKKSQIDDYRAKVRNSNQQRYHIDFDRTGIKFFDGVKVGKPTAKPPGQFKDAEWEVQTAK